MVSAAAATALTTPITIAGAGMIVSISIETIIPGPAIMVGVVRAVAAAADWHPASLENFAFFYENLTKCCYVDEIPYIFPENVISIEDIFTWVRE